MSIVSITVPVTRREKKDVNIVCPDCKALLTYLEVCDVYTGVLGKTFRGVQGICPSCQQIWFGYTVGDLRVKVSKQNNHPVSKLN